MIVIHLKASSGTNDICCFDLRLEIGIFSIYRIVMIGLLPSSKLAKGENRWLEVEEENLLVKLVEVYDQCLDVCRVSDEKL